MTASRGSTTRRVEAMARWTSALGVRRVIRVGPASDPASDMGTQIDKGNVERIDRIVEDAIAKGAKSIVRGGPATEGDLAKGAFYQPA
ncbi:aldehyde dehydrogenase family protein [Paracoccus stylophorae]|uniref:Aldehyde dehydrogenase family protein n=1 Tax=Paracoccus stylophorae TaxID=659350 RepID=A0ABY7SZ78_9RHOB|nr:aldehyde dehydrogenase family protein [Paracoccus stylophorae]WCR12115.1 aldehyde dehydrogenase family protein [Paracoccus stylophorae]